MRRIKHRKPTIGKNIKVICEPLNSRDAQGRLTFRHPWHFSYRHVAGSTYTQHTLNKLFIATALHVDEDMLYLQTLGQDAMLMTCALSKTANFQKTPKTYTAAEVYQGLCELLPQNNRHMVAIAASILASVVSEVCPIAEAWMVALAYECSHFEPKAHLLPWMQRLANRLETSQVELLPPGFLDLQQRLQAGDTPTEQSPLSSFSEFQTFANRASSPSLKDDKEHPPINKTRLETARVHLDKALPKALEHIERPIPEGFVVSGQKVTIREHAKQRFTVVGSMIQDGGPQGYYVLFNPSEKSHCIVHGMYLHPLNEHANTLEILQTIETRSLLPEVILKSMEVLLSLDIATDEAITGRIYAIYLQAASSKRQSEQKRLLHEARVAINALNEQDKKRVFALCPALRAGNRTGTSLERLLPGIHDEIQYWLDALKAQCLPQATQEASDTPSLSDQGSLTSCTATVRPLAFKLHTHVLYALKWTLPAHANAFHAARQSAMEWLQACLGKAFACTTIAEHPWQKHHDVEVEFENRGIFAFQMRHPDRKLPGRSWHVDVSILPAHTKAPASVHLKVHAIDRENYSKPEAHIPAVVTRLLNAPGLFFNGFKCGDILRYTSGNDLEKLRELLTSSDRQFAVGVIGEAKGYIPRADLAAVMPLVHLSDRAARHYSKLHEEGTPADGFMDAWLPGESAPFKIDLGNAKAIRALVARIATRNICPQVLGFREARLLSGTFHPPQHDLTEKMIPSSPEAAVERQHSTAKPAEDAKKQTAISADEELLEAITLENANLRKELDDLKRQNAELRDKNAGLETRLRQQTGEEIEQIVGLPIPETLKDLEAWSRPLEPRVIITKAAIKSAAAIGEHKENRRIYDSLLALANEFWESKYGKPENSKQANERWEKRLGELGMRWSKVGHATKNHRFAPEYQVTHEGRTYTMDKHLCHGNSRDPKLLVRIYLAMDDENQRFIVGHLPTHLSSTLT